MRPQRIRTLSTCLAAALAGVVLMGGTAGAAQPLDTESALAAATAKVDGAAQARGLAATTAAKVDLAATGGHRSTLTDATGRSIGASLEGAAAVGGDVTAEGTVFRDVLPATDAGVERTESGLRLLAVAKNAAAPTEFRFALSLPAGATLRAEPNGSVTVVDQAGGVLGSVNKAWAFDATGAPVATWYSLDGSTLVQHVEHRGAAYPVVADPSIDFGLTSAVITLNPKDQRIILSGGGVAAGGLLGALICSGSGPGAALCAVGGAVIGEIVFEAIKEYAVKDNCDLEVTVGYVPPRVTNVEQVCH